MLRLGSYNFNFWNLEESIMCCGAQLLSVPELQSWIISSEKGCHCPGRVLFFSAKSILNPIEMKYYIHASAIYKVLKQVSPDLSCHHFEIMQEHLSFILECYCSLLDQELQKYGGQLSYDFLCTHQIFDDFSRNEGVKAVTKYRDAIKSDNGTPKLDYLLDRGSYRDIRWGASKSHKAGLQFSVTDFESFLRRDPRFTFANWNDLTEVAVYFTAVLELVAAEIWENASNCARNEIPDTGSIYARHLICGTLAVDDYRELFKNYACYYNNWTISFASLPPFLPETLDPMFIGSKNRSMKIEEDSWREMFVADRNNKSLQNPYLMLIDAYSSLADFTIQQLDSEESKINQLLARNKISSKIGSQSIVDQSSFLQNWNLLTQSLFKGLNWNNVFVAGGSILGCALPDFQLKEVTTPGHFGFNGFFDSDIDLFLYGLDVDMARAKVEEIINLIEKNVNEKLTIMRSQYAITICGKFPLRNVQIVLRVYKSPAEVLMGFDIDCCCIGYDGNKLWALPRAKRAINKRYNLVDVSRRSLTYEKRLYKYSKRGFSVAVPGLDYDMVNLPKAVKAKGLGKLVYYDLISRRVDSVYAAAAIFRAALNKKVRRYYDTENKWSDYNTPISRGFYKEDEITKLRGTTLDAPDGTKIFIGGTELLTDKVQGPLNFVVENPGRQLLTGSFHPVDDDKWYTDSYHDKGYFLCGRQSKEAETSVYESFYNDETTSDVVFNVGEENIKAHKFILAAASPIFKALFFGKLRADVTKPIKISDISPEIFRKILEFAYTTKIPKISGDNCSELLYAAKKYDFKPIQKKCTSFLLEELNVESVFEILHIVFNFDEKFITKSCMNLIENECSAVIQQETFRDIQPALLKSILQLEQLDVTEFALWNAIVKWAKRINKVQLELIKSDHVGDASSSKDVYAYLKENDILSQVHFEFMEEAEKQEILKEGIVTENDLVTKTGRNVRQKLVPSYKNKTILAMM